MSTKRNLETFIKSCEIISEKSPYEVLKAAITVEAIVEYRAILLNAKDVNSRACKKKLNGLLRYIDTPQSIDDKAIRDRVIEHLINEYQEQKEIQRLAQAGRCLYIEQINNSTKDADGKNCSHNNVA